MNRIRTSAITIAAFLTVGAGASAGIAAISPASAETATPSPFSVRVYPGSEKSLDLGKPGFSAGDQELFTGTIVRGGKHIGRMVGSCTAVRVGTTTADQLCAWVLRFADGQISASGLVVSSQQGPGTFALPIVGGTGRYTTAAGQLKITSSEDSIPVSIDLR